MPNFTIPSSNTILANLLNDYLGITKLFGYSVQTDPGSDVSMRYTGLSQQLAIFYSLANQLVNSKEPDTATGADLDIVLNQSGLKRKSATSAQGFIRLVCAAPTTIIQGMLLTGVSNSLIYQTTLTGIYNNGDNVSVQAIDQGANTDLGAGETLQWINLPTLTQPSALVSVALTGGSNAESDSEARARLYSTVQNPAGSGNFQQLVEITSNIDPLIQSVFVYSNYAGAGTQLITATGYQSDGYYIGRDIPHLLTDNQLTFGSSPYNAISQNFGNNLSNDTSAVYGQLPVGIANPYATVITTVNNVPADVSFAVDLPYPVGNPTNGTGGGWLNYQGATWPNPDPAGFVVGKCSVVAVISSTVITIAACSASHFNTGANVNSNICGPTPGLTKIQWIDRSGGTGQGWLVVTATVTGIADNGNNTWDVKLDTPLVCSGPFDFYGNNKVAVGDFIFPASLNAQNYINNIMANFAALGPGEITASIGLKALGASRRPNPNQLGSNIIGSVFTQSLTSQNIEVSSAVKLYEFHTDGSLTNQPPIAAAPPGIFIPRATGLYDISVIQ